MTPAETDQANHEHPPGLRLTFPELAAITEQVELTVTLEPGPWWSATVDALGASACAFDLKPGMDLFDLLEERAVIEAWEIVEGPKTVADETLAVAVRVLALWKTEQLKPTLEYTARVPDYGPLAKSKAARWHPPAKKQP